MPRLKLTTFVDVRPGEVGALLLSAAYFFLLLSGYSILRPLRDAWGIEGGTSNLPWLFAATFVAMLLVNPLYSALVTRGSRRRIVPVVYRFFALNLVGFYVLLKLDMPHTQVGYVFFVWLSVFNLFVVAIFWSFMADLFGSEQGRRLFAFIAVGGSLGALAGPAFVRAFATDVGIPNLLLISAFLLEACTQCVGWLLRHCEARPATMGEGASPDARIGGTILGGMKLVFRDRYMAGVAVQILCLTTTATFLYLLQARIVHDAVPGTTERTAAFATIEMVVTGLELGLQVLITAPLLRFVGLAGVLRVLPVLTAVGSIALAVQPTLFVLTLVQGLRRAVQYAVFRPARELLFTVVDRERKYASKGFIDTVVYRGGDLASAQLFAGLEFLGLKVAGLALAGLPVVAGWYALSGFLGRRQQELAAARAVPHAPRAGPESAADTGATSPLTHSDPASSLTSPAVPTKGPAA